MEADFIIIGAGIAGASVAAQLAGRASVLVLEMENQAGYHTTGRSAAFYAETYGGELIQPLTTASKAFFHHQPDGFAEAPILTPLGAIHIYTEQQKQKAQQVAASVWAALPGVSLLSTAEICERVPCLDAVRIAGGLYDPDCGSLDVAAMHQGYLRIAKKAGIKVLLDATFEQATFQNGWWHVQTNAGEIKARTLVNAAGAWGDEVAVRAGVRPVGLMPLRRTLVTVPNPEGKYFDPDGPVVLDIEEAFYFKPEGKGYLVSPADETPSPPCDAQPEMEDVAQAAYHFGEATASEVKTILSRWAGLRTFAPDRVPVVGFAPDHPAFFWTVGQGGYGIQTAPAWSMLVASLLLETALPDSLIAAGVTASPYSPHRF